MFTRKLNLFNEIKEYYGYGFNTFTFSPLFTQELRPKKNKRSYFFFTKKKRVGTKTVSVKLEQYLTPLALAISIKDDGG